MKAKKLLLIDTPYLAWRAYHALGPLSYEGRRTEVFFGVLRDLQVLQTKFFDFCKGQLIFAFDHGPLKRKQLYPAYKGNRQELDHNRIVEMERVQLQIRQMRDEVLPNLGYRNIFHVEGYEADDVIASICKNLDKSQSGVIISSDGDLFQCLDPDGRISFHNPRTQRTSTWENFTVTHGIRPSRWARVKAIAGCSSDNVEGIRGVGEATAIKYLTKSLAKTTKAYQKIEAGYAIIERNLELVRLPLDKCPIFEIQEDKLTDRRRDRVYQEYGLRSLTLGN